MRRIALLLLLAGCGPKPAPFIAVGARANNAQVELDGAHVCFPEDRGGAVFGTVQRPGEPRGYGYVLVVRTRAPGLRKLADDVSGDGTSFTCVSVLARENDDSRLRVEFRAGPKGTEALRVNDQPVDLLQSRAYLLDDRSGAWTIDRLSATLSSGIPPVLNKSDVEARGRELLNLLE